MISGLAVNTRTRIRDQERSPIAADLKRAMKEKAELGQRTFALTADVSEVHWQVPVHPSDRRFLGCQFAKVSTVYVNTVGTYRVGAAIGRISQYVVGDSRSWWRRVQSRLDDVLHHLFHRGCTFVLKRNVGR